MKKGFRITITVLLILILVGIIFYPKLKSLIAAKFSQSPGRNVSGGRQGPIQGRQLLSVSGFVIRPVEMNDPINSTGTLRPDEEVELSFETSGKIVSINFTEGTRVKKGDLLAKMNDKPLQAQLQKLVAQRKLVEEKEFRQRSLLDKDAISKESYDQIATELQTINADINLIRARISETELHAPFDGIIGLRYLSEGSYATPSTKVARLVKISPIKIEFAISEKYSGEVKIGFPVSFTVDDKTYQAAVYAVDPKIDLVTRTVQIRALYPNKNEELKPGRYTSVTLLLSQISNAVAIPSEAIISEMEGEMVYVYRNGKASYIKVTTGLRTESLVQIIDGLRFGDTLLTTGILQLRQGLPVVLDTVMLNN
jgi:membrane fusion protein (multidrug efflux system)